MLLSALQAALADVTVIGPAGAVPAENIEITGITDDSRAVAPGDLFVALPGVHVDGHRYIEAAVARGATAVLCQYPPGDDPPVPHLLVAGARAAMADVAARFYGDPSARLNVVGVTGTDGKTTTSFLLHAVLQGTGRKAGLISTVAFRIGDREEYNASRQTTPESPDVQRLLAEAVAAGCTHAVIESSSHALMLDRLRHCHVDAGVFTNLTPEHLDFHGTLEEYRAAKARLFAGLGSRVKDGIGPGVAILNRDDPSYAYMAAASHVPVVSYGLHDKADVRARDVQVTSDGLRFQVTTTLDDQVVDAHSPMIGRFNVSNLLAALAYAGAQGIDLAAAAEALSTVHGVPGRMRRVEAGQSFTIVVDYAHTADSLTKALDELRAVTPASGRLIVVFGAAGERDRSKRAPMGRVAAERCDLVVLTDEDPRLEDRLAIIEEIAAGARAAGARDGDTLLVQPDRRDALRAAVAAARPGDTVLLAGKGHESCIIVGTERLPWDEEDEARAAVAALKIGL